MKKNFVLIMLLLGSCFMLSSCLSFNRKSAIEGYEWLEGVWEDLDNSNGFCYKVKIKKNRYSVICTDDYRSCKNMPIKIGYRFAMSEMSDILQLDTDGNSTIQIVEHGRYIIIHDSEWGGPMLTKTSEPTDIKRSVKKYFNALIELFD